MKSEIVMEKNGDERQLSLGEILPGCGGCYATNCNTAGRSCHLKKSESNARVERVAARIRHESTDVKV